MITEFIQFSLTPILIGILAGISCAVPGNFLILKRQALIGDAISHVVLPGIVVAFIFTGVISTIPMLLGAAGAALVAVILIEVITSTHIFYRIPRSLVRIREITNISPKV